VGPIDLGVMIGVSVLALGLMLGKHRVERRDGALLVIVYVAYIGSLFVTPG
jgi:hypothetical protein